MPSWGERGLHCRASLGYVRRTGGHRRGRGGRRPLRKASIPFHDFHRLPGSEPQRDNTMREGELITGVVLPPADFGAHYTYLKIRDRLSYAFALVSVAVGLTLKADTIEDARVALGGVAHKPWRDDAAEAVLKGQKPATPLFRQFADQVLAEAKGRARTISRSNWHGAPSCVPCTRPPRAPRRINPTSQCNRPTMPITESLHVGRPTSRVDGPLRSPAKQSMRPSIPSPACFMAISLAARSPRSHHRPAP